MEIKKFILLEDERIPYPDKDGLPVCIVQDSGTFIPAHWENPKELTQDIMPPWTRWVRLLNYMQEKYPDYSYEYWVHDPSHYYVDNGFYKGYICHYLKNLNGEWVR